METNRIEYKAKLSDTFEKEVVAFLNYRGGGIIYLGIDKHGKAIGITDIDHTQLVIKDRLKNNIVPSCMGLFDLVAEQRGEKDVLKVIVASGSERPYYIKKYGMSERGAFIRTGSASEPMPAHMIETLFARRIRNSIGKIKSPKQDLNFEQLRIYYDSAGMTLNGQFAKSLEFLNEDEVYNYVAYLLADNNTISVKVAKYDGLDRVDLAESNEYGFCSLIKATKQVLDKIEVENKTMAKITPKEREEKRLWNAVALREAIINAMIHNDYTYEVAPKFEFFDGRFEITSYGGLAEGMSRDEFFEGISIPKNKELMRIFRDMDLVEQLGSGIPRILRTYGKECFYFSENYIRMSFPAAIERMATGEHVSIPEGQDVVGNVVGNVVENERKILEHIKSNNRYSALQMADSLQLTQRTVQRYLKQLQEKGVIERIGPAKGGYWKVKE